MTAPKSQRISRYDFSPIIPYLHKLDGAIIDLDGTAVINNECSALDQIGRVFQDFLRVKHNIVDTSLNYRRFAGMPLPLIRQTVGDLYDVNVPKKIEQDIKNLRSISPLPGEDVRVHPFFQGLFTLLDQHHIPMRIATGSEEDRAVRYADAANLRSFFDKGKGPWLFAGHKPAPDCVLAAVDSLARDRKGMTADPDRILAFEDSTSGVTAEAAAGVHVIGHLLAEHIDPADHRERHISMMEAGACAVIRREDQAVHAVACVLSQLIPARRKASFAAVRALKKSQKAREPA